MISLNLVINLTNRTDRRRDMEHQLQRVGMQAEFFPAIRPDDKGEFETIGTRGCFLSHLECLEIALSRDVDILVLMEDDLNFSKSFPQQWLDLYDFLNSDQFDIFYPAHHFADRGPGLIKLCNLEFCTGSHFIVFSRRGIGHVAKALREIITRPEGHPLGGAMHVDGAYATIRSQNHNLITYANFPSIGYQRSSRTDVHDVGIVDRIVLLSPLIRFGRQMKNMLH